MRAWALLFPLLPAGFLLNCGYVGEPLPPALKQPLRVTDLAAVEHGSKIDIRFTVPKVTTENLPLKEPPELEIRIGPAGNPFNMDAWLSGSDLVPMPPAGKPVEVPAAKYYGQTVVIGLNAHGPGGRTAGWSNFQILSVVPALPTPEALKADDAPDAVHLEWRAAAPEFRVFRKLVSDPKWVQIGTSMMPSYTDGTIEYGNTYQYYAQAFQKTANGEAESEASGVVTVKPDDHFAPAVPVGVSAVPGARSIDLVWQRNAERDFASYRIYRDGRKIAEGLTAPAYSDRDVQPGTTYRYEVSSVDTKGNESLKSAPVAAAIP
jgi:hypothetical protein